ncbi:hypothetical protein AVEN_80668-1, partial [Araneus ventricosus]
MRLSPGGRVRPHLQPDDRTVPVQGRRDRHHVQSLRQGIPAEQVPHCTLHQDSKDGGCSKTSRRTP